MANQNETGRVEAFSDGVFAVAITLLVLDIHVPAFKDLPAHGADGWRLCWRSGRCCWRM